MRTKSALETARQLIDVLRRENAALRAMNLPLAADLLAEKAEAVANLAAAGEQTDPLLRPTARTLSNLTLENRHLLERALIAQQRVIGIVVEAAATVAARPSYCAKGRAGHAVGPMALSTRA